MSQILSRKLFDGYSKEFLPRLNESKPVKVSFDFELITIKEVVSNTSNTRDSVSSDFQTLRRELEIPFENTTCSGVFLTKFEVFGNQMKHYIKYTFDISSQSKQKELTEE